jgi:lipopolysaccharide transport system permease protein
MLFNVIVIALTFLSFAVEEFVPIVGVAHNARLFITPIFYPLESLPPLLQSLSFANPFYLLIDAYRGVLLRQDSPSPVALAYLLLLAFVIFHFGLAAFRRAKGQFNSAL